MPRRKSMKRGIQKVDVALYGDEYMALVEKYGDEAMFAAGEVVLREAERRAPRGRTGNLAKSGYVGTRTKSTYVKRRYWRKEKTAPKGGAVVGFTAPHAHLLESGRRKRGVIRPLKGGGKRALRINGVVRSTSKFNRMSSRPFLGPGLDAAATTMVDPIRVQKSGRLPKTAKPSTIAQRSEV